MPPFPRDFPEGIALVVGGSGGVGRAVSVALARSGSDVALTYRSNRSGADEAAQAVRDAGRDAHVHALDLADERAVAEVVDAVALTSPLHTVVFAAGSDIPMRFVSELTADQWRSAMHRDADGFFHVVRASLPHLRKSHGSIVAVTSAGASRTPTRDVLSVAPKGAIEALVRAVAVEEGRFGVRANAVRLGVIEAGIFLRLRGGDLGDDWGAAARKNTPLRRFGTADEAANAVVFLASARASYVTGQMLGVDGGYGA
jgi:3-oxoacyl-[acyl-carrier protein] reductase